MASATNPNTAIKVYVGLFGWDMSCLTAFCAQNPVLTECAIIAGNQVDGLALGVHWDVTPATVNTYYAVGFSHKTESKADTLLMCELWESTVCVTIDGGLPTVSHAYYYLWEAQAMIDSLNR